MAALSHLKNKKEAKLRSQLDKVVCRCSPTPGGPVCVKRFLELLEAVGVEPDEREVARLGRMADEAGEVDKDEFVAFAKKSEAFKNYMDVERKSKVDKAEIAFKAIDRDNSGYITMEEMKKLGKNMNQAKAEALMNKLDTDGDGKITLLEFRELFRVKAVQ